MEGRSQRILAASLGTKFDHNVILGADFALCLRFMPRKNGLCTEASYSYTATKETCKDSSCAVDRVQGSVTGYKDVSTVGEPVLRSAGARQPVSTTIHADQSSFQS